MPWIPASAPTSADRPSRPFLTFKEHEWGYGTDRRGRVLRYAVQHPVWRVYPDPEARVEVDFGAVYGPEWALLDSCTPEHVTLAEGSRVAVHPPERLAPA